MTYTKSDAELLSDISYKLDVVIGLLAIQSMAKEELTTVFERLRDMNLSPRVIARVTGITENAVNIRLSRLRKKKAGTKPATVA